MTLKTGSKIGLRPGAEIPIRQLRQARFAVLGCVANEQKHLRCAVSRAYQKSGSLIPIGFPVLQSGKHASFKFALTL